MTATPEEPRDDRRTTPEPPRTCCEPTVLETCCEPSEKGACCGTEDQPPERCGCQ